MAAGTFTLYRANLDDLRMQDLTGATVKLQLVSSAYTVDDSNTGHSVLADVTNEIANGNGYLTGGATLANDAVSTTTNGFKYDADDVAWVASGGSIPAWRRGVLYVSGSLWGKTNPLIGHFLGDSTPADVPATSDTNTLTVAWNASGIFTLTQA